MPTSVPEQPLPTAMPDSAAARVGLGVLGVQDGLSQSGHVHAGVGLARDVETVVYVLRIHAEEGLDGGEVLRGSAVVVAFIIVDLGVRKAHPDGGLDV
eukprot:CAMPEP_0173258040 /NCGR_PEP_ID=MMETSP1142-20121109/24139_1 /TAXON_ID=483371 /ORGANISM="non described non described, Strain CCMP2298" /LENGTH=97 /DNA_ID=CAMNT_0014192305 /DNA_START=542 /DNA_END=834 /DNA_ORIENTATION=+